MLACVVLLLLGAVTVLGDSKDLERISEMQEKMYAKLTDVEKIVAKMQNEMQTLSEKRHSQIFTMMAKKRPMPQPRKAYHKKFVSDKTMEQSDMESVAKMQNEMQTLSERRRSPSFTMMARKRPLPKHRKAYHKKFVSDKTRTQSDMESDDQMGSSMHIPQSEPSGDNHQKGMRHGNMKSGKTFKINMRINGPDGKPLSSDDPRYKKMMKLYGGGKGMSKMFSGAMVKIGGRSTDLGKMMKAGMFEMKGRDGKPLSKDDPQYKRMMAMREKQMKRLQSLMRRSQAQHRRQKMMTRVNHAEPKEQKKTMRVNHAEPEGHSTSFSSSSNLFK